MNCSVVILFGTPSMGCSEVIFTLLGAESVEGDAEYMLSMHRNEKKDR